METNGTTREESITMSAIQGIYHKMPELELRDLFAMNALNGLLASKSFVLCYPSDYTEAAYEYADAMLKERSKK